MANENSSSPNFGSAAFREFHSTSQALLSSSQLILQQEKSKERQDQLFADQSDAIFFFTSAGKLLKLNRAFANRFGFENDDFFLKDLDVVLPHRIAKVFREQSVALASQSSLAFELPLPKDPTLPFGPQIEHHWSLQRYGKSDIYGDVFVATGRDIQDLRNAEGRISELFRCLPIGLLTITSDERIEEVYSKYSEVILGTSELTGRSFCEKVLNPSITFMSASEVTAVEQFRDLVGQKMEDYMQIEVNLPRLIRRPTPPEDVNSESVLWLALSYYPIATSGVIEKILVIVQNQTDWVREKLERENLHRLSLTDQLTSLGNRRSLDIEVDKILRSPSGTDVAVVLIDVDFFKKFNDHYGHIEGDACLKLISGALKSVSLRYQNFDMNAFRYGGEEFAFLARGLSKADLEVLVEEVLQEVRNMGVIHAGRSDCTNIVTISAGALYHRTDGLFPSTSQAILTMADRLLYQSKNSGRNCATLASSLDHLSIFGDNSELSRAG
jgi:diguanylate cyclase (GGDEF)-like protein